MSETNDWFGPEAATFGDRLAAARYQAGLEQKELAKRLGVKLTTLRGWEDDLSEPRANKLQMVAGILNVSLTWLLNGEGDGVAGPEYESPLPSDVAGILTEMRDIRSQMGRLNDRLGLLEKRLRETMKDTNQ